MELLLDGLQDHFFRAVVISGALALLIAGAVWLVWIRGRHLVDRGRSSLAAGHHTNLFSSMDEPPRSRPGAPASSRDEGQGPGEEQFTSKLVREAAARAAALRDAWDRSYREARGSEATPSTASRTADTPSVMDELLREQRETNALLRQLVDRLTPPKT